MPLTYGVPISVPGEPEQSRTYAAYLIAPTDASKPLPRVAGDRCIAIDTQKEYVSFDGAAWTERPTQGAQGSQGNPGTAGASGGHRSLHPPFLAASAAATNLAASTFSAVSDPNYRVMTDLRGLTKIRIQGRIGGSLVAATKLRVQYHTGGDPAIGTGDGGWTTLADSAGSHTLNVMFYSAEISVPAGAQINNVLIRVGLFGGDGAADPTITTCVLNFYP
jgi:hypothetical protein